MNKYFEAVKKGGDCWRAHLDEKTSMAQTRNLVWNDSHKIDSLRMDMAEKYPAARRDFQNYTPPASAK